LFVLPIDVYIEKESERLAGEGRMTATTHAAFAYTGSGYKTKKKRGHRLWHMQAGEAGRE
jgi:hypothetical protein